MLRQAIITSKTANAIAVANTVLIVANERTYITPYANVRNTLFPWTEKAPAIAGQGKSAERIKRRNSALPLCVLRVGPNTSLSLGQRPGTCSSAPKICLLKPSRQARIHGAEARLPRRMNEPVTLCFGGGYAILSFCILPSAFTLGIARPGSG